MARRGGRRGSRGRSSSRRSRGKTGGVGSSRSKSKSNRSKSKSTGGSRGRSSNTRGGQSKANRNQNKKARRTVKSVKKAVGSVAKGIGKSLRGAAANAAGHTKKKSKLQQQFSNLKNNIQRQSTPEAKKQRRADRLRRQFGLDYSSMNPSFKANVNVSQAYKHLGLDKFAPTRAVYNRLPKSIRNFSWKHQFNAPTKRGVRDGYRAPNRGGRNVAANTRDQLQSIRSQTPGYKGQSLQGDTELAQLGGGIPGSWLDFYQPDNQRRLRDQYTTGQPITRHPGRIDGPIPDNPIRSIRQHPGRRGPDQIGPGGGLIPLPARPRPIRGQDQFGPGWGIPPGRPPRPIRRPDTIEMMYENILGRKADQGGLDYWKNELSSGRQTKDAIRQNILRSNEFQGRSEADREAVHRGVKRRKFQRERRRRGKPPRQRHGSTWKGVNIDPRFAGRPKGRAKPTGRKPTSRGLFPSIAASMAARGFK